MANLTRRKKRSPSECGPFAVALFDGDIWERVTGINYITSIPLLLPRYPRATSAVVFAANGDRIARFYKEQGQWRTGRV